MTLYASISISLFIYTSMSIHILHMSICRHRHLTQVRPWFQNANYQQKPTNMIHFHSISFHFIPCHPISSHVIPFSSKPRGFFLHHGHYGIFPMAFPFLPWVPGPFQISGPNRHSHQRLGGPPAAGAQRLVAGPATGSSSQWCDLDSMLEIWYVWCIYRYIPIYT